LEWGLQDYVNSQFSNQNRHDAISRFLLSRGESTNGLAAEKHNHINSAGCEGMATTVTAAQHSIWYDSKHAAQKPKSKLKFVTLDKASESDIMMSTLCRREEFRRIWRAN